MPSPRRAFAHRIFVFLLIIAVVGIVGCGHRNAPAPAAKADLAAANAQIAQPAWLDERLPAHTVVYARIPSLWGLLSAPDGRPLDPVLASAEHIKIIASLRDAVRRDKLIEDTGAAPVLGLLLGDQGGPMELALIDISDQPTPAGNLLLTTRLDVPDIAALNAHVAALAGNAPLLKAPFDANGSAELQSNGFLQFDLATHRLYAFVGMGATRMGLDDTLKQLSSTRTHPMQDAEREIDSSGQGLFVWINLKGLAGLVSAQMPQMQPGTLLRDLLDRSQSLALGWGTVGGHGRMQLLLYAPDARLLGYLAPDRIDANLKTAGKPNWVATLALPGTQQIQAIENDLDQDFGAGTQQKYRDAMAKAKDRAGLEPTDFARTIGPDVLMFSDANGRFTALRMRDRTAFYAQLDMLGKRFGFRSSVTRVGDIEIHQLHIPGFTPTAQSGSDPHAAAWLKLYQRIGSHAYWVEDGDYLIFASVPQLLIDRAVSKPDTSLGDWLRDMQSGHDNETLLGFSGTSKNAQRDMYYTYLGMLQALGDVLGQPVDLMPMPAANGLHLPIDGVYGASISVNKSRIGFSLSYEQSPAELVTNGAGGTYGTVAVVAILAAIAIPAYQDYVIRAQVMEGSALAKDAKTAVSEFRLHHNGMPADNAALGLAPATSISGQYVSEVQVNDGEIRVTYSSHAPQKANTQLDGGVVVLSPAFENGTVRWTCASPNIAPKYLPSFCRQ